METEFDASRMICTYTLEDQEDDDGNELEPLVIELPMKFEVCSRCAGKGTHVNPSVDGHGITQSERENEWSHDEWEGYLSGAYDVTCDDCRGQRVMPVVDEEAVTRQKLDAEYEIICEHETRAAMYAREEAHERRMGY